MHNEFYYLDGLEKKGPYTFDEILSRKLPLDTLIYLPEKGKWEKLSEVISQAEIEKVKEPELVKESVFPENARQELNVTLPEEKTTDPAPPSVTQPKLKRSQIYVVIFLISSLLTSIAIFAHMVIDKNSLKSKIDEMMLGKKAVCDFEYSEPVGELTPLYPYSADEYKQIIRMKLGDEGSLEHWPEDSVLITDNILSVYDKNEKPMYFDFYKKYVEFFHYESGGLLIYTLKKTNNGFDVVTTQSGNYAYFIREEKYNPVLEMWTPTYRASVREAHEKLFDSYSEIHAPEGYIKNSKSDILKIPAQKSLFYQLENLPPSDTTELGGSVNTWASWHTVNSGSALDILINGHTYPYSNEQCAIWIRDEGEHYEYSLLRVNLFIWLGIYFVSFFAISFAVWKLYTAGKTGNRSNSIS